jgi:hypothetical protein
VLHRLITAVTFIVVASASVAQPVPPLPPRRPAEPTSPATPEMPPVTASPAVPGADAPQVALESDLCLSRLRAAGFDVEPANPDRPANELCRIQEPVRLKAVPVPSKPGAVVRLTEEPTLACRFAEPFGHWIGDLVVPVIAGVKNADLKAVRTGPGFECRNRNGAATGKLSAHAEGLAIDIAGFDLGNGSILPIKPDAGAMPDPALAALRAAACGWFTTILGPGSDEAHHDHLHVDIERHGSSERYRICQ